MSEHVTIGNIVEHERWLRWTNRGLRPSWEVAPQMLMWLCANRVRDSLVAAYLYEVGMERAALRRPRTKEAT